MFFITSFFICLLQIVFVAFRAITFCCFPLAKVVIFVIRQSIKWGIYVTFHELL